MKNSTDNKYPDRDKSIDDMYDKNSNPFVHVEVIKGKRVLKSQFIEEWAKMLKKL